MGAFDEAGADRQAGGARRRVSEPRGPVGAVRLPRLSHRAEENPLERGRSGGVPRRSAPVDDSHVGRVDGTPAREPRPLRARLVRYCRISRTWGEVVELDKWMRRRVRQCYWKQWGRSRRRRKMLLRLGADPATVHLASRSRKGCWRMSTNSLVQAALTNAWLGKQGAPDYSALWVAYHYPPPPKAEPKAPGWQPGRVNTSEPPDADPHVRLVWGPGANYPRLTDCCPR
jgi:hypothetical protein